MFNDIITAFLDDAVSIHPTGHSCLPGNKDANHRRLYINQADLPGQGALTDNKKGQTNQVAES